VPSAKLALRRGEANPDGFTKAAEIFGRLGMRYFRAVALAEDAECGNDSGADEAREIFQQVGAQPWLDRLDAELARSMQATSTSSP